MAGDGKYVGEWFNGEKEGLGVLVKPGKGIYTGQYSQSKPNGRGFFYNFGEPDAVEMGFGKMEN